jgi:nucleoside-diphosphate-sugar epimerase
VVHQLTALPKGGARRASDLQPTNRLRIDGTRNLLDAAIHAGARRFIVGSVRRSNRRDVVNERVIR